MEQCKEFIYKRDTYRRTGRGKNGFELHYIRQQCARRATSDGYCWQHPYGKRPPKWRVVRAD